ncbi:MAG: hypothetical protein K0Q79_1852 [Flavipsychrobacter sp.]|jgi:hypothetical protein|nr:hypothetical protein [Flavipsychrobacter sp.]
MKYTHLLKTATLFGAFLITINANAQMVGTDIFLKGRFVELGIGHNGYYGSDSPAPSGYHPRPAVSATSGILGFVADPAATGWSTSSGSHYNGDYFTPGFPFEGWSLEINGNRCQGYNNASSSSALLTTGPACSGSNFSYTTSGTKVIGTWKGTFDSVDITQITTLDTNQAYFTVKVILTNTASAAKNNIYYFRSLDPDNDVTWPGGSFVTNNLIEYQLTDTTIVSATGTSSSAPYMALGTTDTAATAIIYNGWPISISTPSASGYLHSAGFGSTAFYTAGVTQMGDKAIGLMMYIPHLATVDSAGDSVYRTTATYALHPANQGTFNYFYAFSPAARDSAIASLNSTPSTTAPLAIKNVNVQSDIQVYPNPSGEILNITNLVANDRITLFDLMGRDMRQNWSVARDGTNTFRYEDVPAGSYVLVITDEGGNVKARIPVRKL